MGAPLAEQASKRPQTQQGVDNQPLGNQVQMAPQLNQPNPVQTGSRVEQGGLMYIPGSGVSATPDGAMPAPRPSQGGKGMAEPRPAPMQPMPTRQLQGSKRPGGKDIAEPRPAPMQPIPQPRRNISSQEPMGKGQHEARPSTPMMGRALGQSPPAGRMHSQDIPNPASYGSMHSQDVPNSALAVMPKPNQSLTNRGLGGGFGRGIF